MAGRVSRGIRSLQNGMRSLLSHDPESDPKSEEQYVQTAPAQLSLASFGSTSTVDFPIDYECSSAIAWAAGSEPLQPPIVQVVRSVSEPTAAPTTSEVHAESRPHLFPKMSVRSAFTGRTTISRLEKKDFFKGLFHVSDNQFAMKLFGSRNGIEREEERLKNCRHCVIHPCSKIRIYWDLLMIAVLFLNVLLLPVSIAFVEASLSPGWLSFHCFSDAVFTLDIILNFWTGVITGENTVILDMKVVRKMYAKKWLAMDIISVFPFDYITVGILKPDTNLVLRTTRALRLLRLLKLLSLLRLFRVVRFMHYLSKWEEIFNATRSVARIGNFLLAVLLLAHWNGCIQFLVPYIQGFPRDSWVSINNLQNATVGIQYSWAVFKAISHMLCIGFGRWPPQNGTEVWITIISMLIGASLYAMFIGHISTLIHSVDYSSRQYNETLKQVEEYMRYRKLPVGLKRRVHAYYYQRYRGQLFSEKKILKDLSQALKEEIAVFNCQELVRVVPFFSNADQAFITSVVTRLTFDVFLPGDYIVRCGAIGRKMYFIQHGMVDIITGDDEVATCLCDGSYFGEISMLMKCRRVASVKAVTACDLYCLDKEDFQTVLDEYPPMRRMMEAVARERLSMLPTSTQPHASPEQDNSSLTDHFAILNPRLPTLTEEEGCADPSAVV